VPEPIDDRNFWALMVRGTVVIESPMLSLIQFVCGGMAMNWFDGRRDTRPTPYHRATTSAP
jgi:hypothetical protein